MSMGVGKQFLASITGNIETAKLLVFDYREKKNGGGSANLASDSLPNSSGTAPGNLTGSSTAAMSNFRTSATATADQIVDVNYPTEAKIFTVHFNPSKLELYSSTIPVKKPDAAGNEPIHDSTTKAKMTLTVVLFFDEMNVYDSFMVDKFTMGASASALTNIASSALSNSGKKTWSVRDEVEGLTAALRNPLTRNVSFRWADFVFTGQLITVNSQYTMFNTHGEPVRAQATLRIKQEMDDQYLLHWYQDYDNAMNTESSSLGKAAQKVGNLLNFNI